MNLTTTARVGFCRACKQHKPSSSLHHEHAGKYYCSTGCAAKAAWLFSAIPLPRRGEAA